MFLTKYVMPDCMSLSNTEKGILQRSNIAPWDISVIHRNTSDPLIKSSGNRSDVPAWNAGEEGKEKGKKLVSSSGFSALQVSPIFSEAAEIGLGVPGVSSKNNKVG